MNLIVLADRLAVCRLAPDAPVPAWAGLGEIAGLAGAMRTAEELSVVCGFDRVPADVTAKGPMRAFRMDGPLPFDAIGIAAGLSTVLAATSIPLLMLATFNTGYVLVDERRIQHAVQAFTDLGYTVNEESAQLRYATVATPFGRLIAAATPQGLVWAALGDSNDALLDDLRRAFPSASLAHDDEALAPTVDALLRTLGGVPYDRPLDLRGTPFQQRVWARLRAVPFGQTTTYGHLAGDLGLPAAGARTVGSAVAANPAALAVPCHRVVRTDGQPTNFRWGAARKVALLQHEGHGQLTLFDGA